ncbi:hypothetical protein F4804DRAFT_349688 [Jackrogersella minutella]|nr:hypothetical protein F4804DRAFT_349688 [Jackrogersella minutella]
MSDGQEVSNTPMRVAVQTKTHLVPGDDFYDRCQKINNLICQHLWNQDHEYTKYRWSIYRAEFAFHNRTCYFFLDHCRTNNDEPPVSWYKWKGTEFTPEDKRQLIRARFRYKMKMTEAEIEFMRRPSEDKLLKELIDPMFWDQLDALTEGKERVDDNKGQLVDNKGQ